MHWKENMDVCKTVVQYLTNPYGEGRHRIACKKAIWAFCAYWIVLLIANIPIFFNIAYLLSRGIKILYIGDCITFNIEGYA
jgi:hypothetical protein